MDNDRAEKLENAITNLIGEISQLNTKLSLLNKTISNKDKGKNEKIIQKMLDG